MSLFRKQNRSEIIRTMTGLGVLTALTIVLGFISNYVKFGILTLNLALLPIVIGACLYGPLAGLFLGVIDAILIIVAPDTSLFIGYNVWYTILICVAKTGLAGLCSGFIYRWLSSYKYKFSNVVAAFVAAVIVPVINTGIFTAGVFTLFLPLYESLAGSTDGAVVSKFILGTIFTTNFWVEFTLTAVFVPAIVKVIDLFNKLYSKKYKTVEDVIEENPTVENDVENNEDNKD